VITSTTMSEAFGAKIAVRKGQGRFQLQFGKRLVARG
jgi:hypothetical protein